MEDTFGHMWASHLCQRVLAFQPCSSLGHVREEQAQSYWAGQLLCFVVLLCPPCCMFHNRLRVYPQYIGRNLP